MEPAHSSSAQHARASDVLRNSSPTWNNIVAELNYEYYKTYYTDSFFFN